MTGTTTVFLPPRWVDGWALEEALRVAVGETQGTARFIYHIPVDCKVMVDAGARLLSLINQQVADGISVVLDFEWPNESIGYLNRAGFFRLLPSDVEVRPARPDDTLVTALMGNSSTLVEFRAIAPDKRDTYDVPRTLSATLKEATRGRADARLLNNATELIDNIYQHSQTRLDGYAALQVYAGAGKACVVVSDSGVGLLNTLEPALFRIAPDLVGQPEAQVIKRMFEHGLSRLGMPRGSGLQSCAHYAAQCRATIHLRLATCALIVSSSGDVSLSPKASCQDRVPLYGTHFCVIIPLD